MVDKVLNAPFHSDMCKIPRGANRLLHRFSGDHAYQNYKEIYKLSPKAVKDVGWTSQPAITCSKLTIVASSGVFIVNFEHISHFLVLLLLILNI